MGAVTKLNSHPLVVALLIGSVVVGGLGATDWFSRPRLTVSAINAAEVPILDGDISDDAWKFAEPAMILTRHGGDFGGSGESKILVRAVHDDHFAYFALQWDDPTRSLEFLPMLKQNGVWRDMQTGANVANERRFFDDRIAIMLAPPGRELIGGAIHLGSRPLDGGPASTTGRGLHFTARGKMVDMWIWHAALGAATDRIQDAFLGAPRAFTEAELSGANRYLGGIDIDEPDHPVAMMNFEESSRSVDGTVTPLRLPRSPGDALAAGAIKQSSQDSDPPDHISLWSLGKSKSVPYSKTADKALPDGTVIPGVIAGDEFVEGSNDVIGRGKWAGGQWVLELRRSLDASDNDVPIKNGTMLWFAAFDHSQSRHTYHLRPLVLEMQ
jgi:hypothetical protein